MWITARQFGVLRLKSTWSTCLVLPTKLIYFKRALTSTTDGSRSSKTRRMNSLGIQMLSKPLHRQIFGDKKPSCSSKGILRSKEHLKEQGLWGREGTTQPDIDLQLPELQGDNLDQHFRNVANELGQPYLQLALGLSNASLPPLPEEWYLECGWKRYNTDGTIDSVEVPADGALVFDVEVCVRDSPRPVLAIAVGTSGWYSWVSEHLVSGESFFTGVESTATLNELIPMESAEGHHSESQERLIVGHNISYDRARIKEQYFIESSKTKFLDTLSLHTCVAGQTSLQKVLWQAARKNSDLWRPWMDVSSPNSLADVHWCHVTRGKRRVSKEQRSVFVNGTIQDVRNEFQACMQYCARDVLYTHEVLQRVLPRFLERYPHPVTFAGMLEMGNAYLPVNESWEQYIEDAEFTYEEMESEVKSKLMALADEGCSYMKNQRYLESPWLCNLDWSAKVFRGKALKTKKEREQLLKRIEEQRKEGEELERGDKFEFVISSTDISSLKQLVHMPGYPEWYRALCLKRNDPSWRPGAVKISAQTRVTPYLLRMKWQGHPLFYHTNLGWGYIVSMDTKLKIEPTSNLEELYELDTDLSLDELMEVYNEELEDEDYYAAGDNGVNVRHVFATEHVQIEEEVVKSELKEPDDIVTIGNGGMYYYFKIPHKDGGEANCGNPLSKDYLPKMEDGTLTSGAGDIGRRILELNSMMSFWRSARNRIMQQLVVWLDDQRAGKDTLGPTRVGAIVPQVIVAGTATRRAVEPTWLTASNAKSTRVGSEQKAMIQAPPGYHIVGADVDSQELWIAALLGDVHFAGIHGCTAIGWMTLQGKKADETDVHSNTAKTIGISRDHAKILNYGRFYGAGKPFIKLLLRKFNPSLSTTEVEEKAELLYTSTKGVRMYKLTKKGQSVATDMDLPLIGGCLVSQDSWRLLCDVHGYHSTMRMISSREWYGGSESQLFNKLESIALSDHPTTPVLGCSLTTALEKQNVGNQFQPSRVNWVVQSSAVDYLHLLLVACQWIFKRYNISGRFCISIHDEVRYLVRSEDCYRAALALQIANLYTRAMFAHKLGLRDLPMSVAFFSGVDIDRVMRKEASMDCTTPSNPLGLERGYGIPNGEVLDIYQLIEKTNGRL